MSAPIDVNYEQIKRMLDVGGYDNLSEEQVYDLILLVPCYVMKLRENAIEAFHTYKAAKSNYQLVYAGAFLSADGSVEVKKMKACMDEQVVYADKLLTEAESEYERAKQLPEDWLELQQALKRLADVKFRKAGVS